MTFCRRFDVQNSRGVGSQSARWNAKILQVLYSIVLRHLHDDLGFRCFYLHSVPHLLTQSIKDQKRRYARGMIPLVKGTAKDG
jgi:hypothetical protein